MPAEAVATAEPIPGSPPAVPLQAPPAPQNQRRGPLRWGRITVVVASSILALVVAFLLYGVWQFSRMDRVAVSDSLSSATGSGTNYLIVGSDSREGFDPSDPTAGAVLHDGTADDPTSRSDTMLILRITDGGALMLSIPRDLWVTRSDGSAGRINAAYRDGPEELIRTVQRGVGIPVHHYVEVDFVSFAGMVEAVGGVVIDIAHPARDEHSGLDLPEAGPVSLSGSQALAFVRSRRYSELIDGTWRTDPRGDLGRVERQQVFLRAVMGKVGASRNPIELARISGAVSSGLRVDDDMGLFDALRFARRLRGLDPESVELPVFPFTASGGAAVLGLVEPDADAVIARFNS